MTAHQLPLFDAAPAPVALETWQDADGRWVCVLGGWWYASGATRREAEKRTREMKEREDEELF